MQITLPAEGKVAEVADIAGLLAQIARLDARIDAKASIAGTADVPGLNAALALKAALASPVFTGSPKAPTPAAGDDSTLLATTAFVQAAIAALVAQAPATLATLNAIATALGNDPNLATTLTALIAGKQDVLTGIADVPGLDAALGALQPALTALSDVPGLVTALAAKQASLTGINDVPGLASALAAKQDATGALKVYATAPDSATGANGDVALVLDPPSLVRKEAGSWALLGSFVPAAPATPDYDDTRMTATGIARNGPGLYAGFTAVSGSGTVSVYEGNDAGGTLLHQVVNPAAGVFQAPPAPVMAAGIHVVQGGRTVDYRID